MKVWRQYTVSPYTHCLQHNYYQLTNMVCFPGFPACTDKNTVYNTYNTHKVIGKQDKPGDNMFLVQVQSTESKYGGNDRTWSYNLQLNAETKVHWNLNPLVSHIIHNAYDKTQTQMIKWQSMWCNAMLVPKADTGQTDGQTDRNKTPC